MSPDAGLRRRRPGLTGVGDTLADVAISGAVSQFGRLTALVGGDQPVQFVGQLPALVDHGGLIVQADTLAAQFIDDATIIHLAKTQHGGVRPVRAGTYDLMIGGRRRGIGPRLTAKRRNAVEQNRQQHDRPPLNDHHYAQSEGTAKPLDARRRLGVVSTFNSCGHAGLAGGAIMTGSFHIGGGGWTFEPWRGVFYPEGVVQKRDLEFASRALTSIE